MPTCRATALAPVLQLLLQLSAVSQPALRQLRQLLAALQPAFRQLQLELTMLLRAHHLTVLQILLRSLESSGCLLLAHLIVVLRGRKRVEASSSWVHSVLVAALVAIDVVGEGKFPT